MQRFWLAPIPLLFLLLIPAGCTSTANNTFEKSPLVRVKIFENQEQVLLAASTPPVIQTSNQAQRVNFSGSQVPVTLSPQGWHIGNATFALGELSVVPQAVGSVSVNGANYRGRYRFVPTSGNRFDVVNDVDIDSYLMGVVSRELLADWNLETYKAQAIVARTYALYEIHTAGGGRSFDVYTDQRSQVYGGIAAESAKSRAAAADTAGVVVAYGPKGEEKIFKAYFSSCCGGVGQSAYDAFGDPDIPPLRERYVGNLCAESPKFNWGPIIIKKDELTRRIRAWGARRNSAEKDMAMITRIDIAAVNRYGRPVRFFYTDARGVQYSLNGEEMRWSCNADANGGPVLPSSFCKPVDGGDTIQFVEGHGWGHGVGMCQWCAQTLAQRGMHHEDIVRLSYPGAVLVRAY